MRNNISRLVLTAGALACFTFLAYAVSRRSMVTTTVAVIAIYVVPLVAGVLLLAATRLAEAHRLSLVVTLLAACLSLYGVEVFLASRPRQIDPRVSEIVRATDVSGVRVLNAWAWRSPAAGGVGLRIEVDGDTVLPLAPGVADAATVLCSHQGKPLIYHSDQRGFNNERHAWQSTPLVVAIGDSFTQGFCVPAEQSFIGRLRARGTEVLNLGVAGAGPLFQLAIMREYVAELRPPVVLWFYYEGNDLADLVAEWEFPILRRYLIDGHRQHLYEHQAAVDRALRPVVQPAPMAPRREGLDLLALAKLTRVRTVLGLSRYGVRFSRFSQIEPQFESVLRAAQALVHDWSGKLYFVYLPTHARFERKPYASSSFHDRREVLSLVRRVGISIIDVAETFGAQPAPATLWPYAGAHYGPEGHRLTAEAVAAELARTGTFGPAVGIERQRESGPRTYAK